MSRRDEKVARLDVIVFGATGMTGYFACQQMAKQPHLTWGIAGRDRAKLEKTLKQVEDTIGRRLSGVQVFVANVNDMDSLLQMTGRTRILLNCVGPYEMLGEPVVQACIHSATHYLDITAELPFVKQIQKKYTLAARNNNVYIIHSCGFASIPSDLGVVYAQQNFQGQINSIETYLQAEYVGTKKPGPQFGIGTWDSITGSISIRDALYALKRGTLRARMPTMTPALKPRSIFHRNAVLNKWTVPIPLIDTEHVLSTQEHFFIHEQKRPIQFRIYGTLGHFLYTFLVLLIGSLVLMINCCSFGKKIIRRYAYWFSLGLFNRKVAPDKDGLKNVAFSFTFVAEGWKEILSNPTDQYDQPPNKRVIFKVSGVDPAYESTTTALVLSALTLLNETDKIPFSSGCLSPGVAFANTKLIERLNENGLRFEIVSTSSI